MERVAGMGEYSATRSEPANLEDLYRVEYVAMVRVAFLIVGSDAESQEIVHDSFAEMIERWHRIDEPGAYLRRAVVNRCTSRLRRRRVERRYLDSSRPPSQAAAPETPLIDALGHLPVRQRTALVMRFYLDASELEIAHTLGARPGTVKSLIHRGLKAPREEIER